MPLDLMLPPPAIVEFQSAHEVRFGLSYAPSRTELDRFIVPRDWRDATVDELRAYIPGDLRDMPDWAIQSMFPLFARKVGSSGPAVKTTVFLTSTSGSNQTWDVLSDWNSSENIVHCIGGGGNGRGRSNAQSGGGHGGGGGGYGGKENISITPSGTVSFFIGIPPAVSENLTGNGATTWFGGTSAIDTLVSGRGAGGGTASLPGPGGLASADGDVTYAGGSGSAASSGNYSGAGGGAAGPFGAGGDATASTGGTGGGGSGGAGGTSPSGSGGQGTEFQSSPAYGSGGGAGGRLHAAGTGAGGNANNYGGGGSGAYKTASGGSGFNGGQGGQGLIVIINNHLTGI